MQPLGYYSIKNEAKIMHISPCKYIYAYIDLIISFKFGIWLPFGNHWDSPSRFRGISQGSQLLLQKKKKNCIKKLYIPRAV